LNLLAFGFSLPEKEKQYPQKRKTKNIAVGQASRMHGWKGVQVPPVLHNKKHIKTCMKKIENSMDRGCNDIYSCKVWI